MIRTQHFRFEQSVDHITEDEIAAVWTRHDWERPSQDHPGAVVRTAEVADGSRVSVVGRFTGPSLVLITTWRHPADDEH